MMGLRVLTQQGQCVERLSQEWSLDQKQGECMGLWGPVLTEAEHP